jgi:hypothetical protein
MCLLYAKIRSKLVVFTLWKKSFYQKPLAYQDDTIM